MDNPLAFSDSDSDLSSFEDGENPLAGGATSESDAESDAGSSGGMGDDLLASLMPTSKIGVDVESSSDSEEEEPMTAAQIQAMRANAQAGRGTAEVAGKRDYVTEIGESGRVPMMFGTSATSGQTVRIDWQSITKDDIQTFIDLFTKHVDHEAQFNRESNPTAAWLLQHQLGVCLALMTKVVAAEGAEGSGDLQKIAELTTRSEKVGLSKGHLSSKKVNYEAVQSFFGDMTDAIADVSSELRHRLGETLHSHAPNTNLARVQELLAGLEAWLDAGADPTDPLVWSGLQRRSTWAPAMELKDHILYVEDMQLKHRRKKHVSCDTFDSGQHAVHQHTPPCTVTRAWLLKHALEHHVDTIIKEFAQPGTAEMTSLQAVRKLINTDTVGKIVQSVARLDFTQEVIDALSDMLTEYTARKGRLQELGPSEMERLGWMVEELEHCFSGGTAAKESGQEWRAAQGDHVRLSKRWHAVFVQEHLACQLMDIFDHDDLGALTEKVVGGLPVDALVDDGGESMLMAASARNAWRCGEWLLEHGVTANGRNDDGSTAFHYACAFGSLHTIACLLKASCDIECVDDDGCTAIALADAEPWADILEVMCTLAENNQWNELDVLIEDQTRVKSIEEMVEAEAERRRPDLGHQSLPPSRWMQHHVAKWMSDTFAWAPQYLDAVRNAGVDGEGLVGCDRAGLAEKYGISEEQHQADVLMALEDQDLWGWE